MQLNMPGRIVYSLIPFEGVDWPRLATLEHDKRVGVRAMVSSVTLQARVSGLPRHLFSHRSVRFDPQVCVLHRNCNDL